jgi:CheY-like chemotaxis protein/anti-sigma regulatory factor (Ser/Thr protein kinase)
MLELKDFSRLDGQAESRVDINAALESALRIVGNLVHHRARLERDLGPALPVSYLNVGRVSQIFLNLLTNATQAFDGPNTGQNVIRVSTRLVEDRIRVQVCDSGRGIPPEIRELVFKPFFTTRREQGGTGLGLSIVRECVQALGGEIELESEVGRGTCVTVCLPVRASRAGLPAVRPAAAGAPRRRVLIVDDDARLLRALERALEREFEVTTTVSPGRALELIRARPFDAILCDVMIPSEMSGPELARRACAERPELGRKFVFMTGGTFDPDEEVALARCDQVVIAKPLDFKALIAVLGSC